MAECKKCRVGGKWRSPFTTVRAAVIALAVSMAGAAATGSDIVLMLDMSMDATEPEAFNLPSQNIINALAGGARAAAIEIKPSDRVSLITFSGDAKIVLPLTSDTRKFESVLGRTGTLVVQTEKHHLYDSLLTAMNSLSAHPQVERRHCILVVTTSADLGSRHSVDDVVLAARANKTTVFVALVDPQVAHTHVFAGKTYPKNAPPNEDDEKRSLAPLVHQTAGDIRIYEQSPYVIAHALQDMVNK